VSDLEKVDIGERQAAQEKVNSRIASMHLWKVLAAHVVVFQLLSDELDPFGGDLHPFVRIIRRCLHRASNEALDALRHWLDALMTFVMNIHNIHL
jgi:hypothetical protein